MNTNRSKNSSGIKNFGLAACAIMALSVMVSGEAAAQCQHGGGNSGYGYNSNYGAAYGGYGNNYGYGSNYSNRGNVGYNSGYGVTSGYQGYANSRPQLSLGLSYNSNVNSGYRAGGYNTAAYSNRSVYGSTYRSNSQQPVTYQHGHHIDVQDNNGRHHLTGRGY